MFAVGDKVVRIRPVSDNWHINDTAKPVTIGGVYLVTGSVLTDEGWAILLDNEEPHRCDCCFGESGWNPDGFRKIHPCDPEFAELLKRIKPKVDA